MSLVQLGALFSAARDVAQFFGMKSKFCWHGGEPLLLDPAYLHSALDLQARIFDRCPYTPKNVIQTNLTILDQARIRLLKRFDHVSISLDVAGGLRQSQGGKDIQPVILRNMAQLDNEGIAFGAIAVLTRCNADAIDHIFDFFNTARVSFRLLPFYRSASGEQSSAFSLSIEEVAELMTRVVDLWFTRNAGIEVSPVDDYLKTALSYHLSSETRSSMYEKRVAEYVFVVDTSGDLYGVADTYDRSYCYGNVFSDPPHALLNSEGRARAIADAESRISSYCANCIYRGHCYGWWIGEATPIQRPETVKDGCVVAKKAIGRIVEWLDSALEI